MVSPRKVDRLTGRPATVYVPPEDVVEVVDCHECSMTVLVTDPRTYLEDAKWWCADCWLDAHPEVEAKMGDSGHACEWMLTCTSTRTAQVGAETVWICEDHIEDWWRWACE